MKAKTTLDQLSITTLRILAADIVQKANSGHPGAPMGCAPMAHVLFSRFIKCSPASPQWINRDRFVLSNGHGCALLYMMLHLMGYPLSLDDLKSFRQLDSKTPGHPEANHGVPGIEVSTGPLGQGISNAVGLAIAQAHMAATFNKPSYDLFSNFTYVITGDGCLQEGVALEAISLAGHLKLGRLIVLYDDNHISIDGDTALGFTENVMQRFDACGWHVQEIGNGDDDLESIIKAIEVAKSVKDKPSLIKIRTTIGFGSLKAGEEKVHGAPLGDADIAQLKTKFGFNPNDKFVIPEAVYSYYREFSDRNNQSEVEWSNLFASYSNSYPDLAAELRRRLEGRFPNKWVDLLPTYSSSDPAVATRKLSEAVLNKIAPMLPELMGGSADLTGSNLTRWKTAADFQSDDTGLGTYAGRYIRFGVREHAMAAVCNGISAYGGIIPFGATFFNFIGYALGAVRLSALSKHQVLYIMTHDSIGLGEDGPTHQPIEALASIRSMPNILTLRPADGNETSGCYRAALENTKGPSVLILTRQNLPHLAGSTSEKTLKGAYVLHEASSNPDAIIVATGSEVSLAVEASSMLSKESVLVRVVSMPSWELFEKQELDYKLSIFPDGIPVLSLEAMSTFGWDRYAHASIGINTFGASAPAKDLMKKFGFTNENVCDKVKSLVRFCSGKPVESRIKKPWV